MMSLNNCKVVFDDRPSAIYFAGETVSGTINIELTKNKSCKAFVLKISGKARCKWEESSGMGDDKKTNSYWADEFYFRTINNLLNDQHENNSGSYNLLAGHYTSRFSYDLPEKLPSSFESFYGHIRYKVKVTMNRSFKMDLSHETLFTVISPTDLNLIPGIRLPITMEESKMFYIIFFQRGKLYLKTRIPYSGYVPGQPIHIECSLINESSVHIKSLTLTLMKKIVYTAKSNTKTKHQALEVSSCVTEGVNVNDKKMIQAVLEIPSIPPSTLGLSSIINVSYEIWATANTSGMHFNLICKTPITIGTVPISKTVHVSWEQPTTSSSAPPIDYSELAPPTYEQAMAFSEQEENDDIKPDESEDLFKPKYPIYNFNNSNKE